MRKHGNIFTGSCRTRRGCSIDLDKCLDRQPFPIYMEMYGTRDDIQKILSVVDISLDKKLEKKGQMEEKVS